jgi:hypothetical protein
MGETPPYQLPDSADSSNNSSTNPSRTQSLLGARNAKPSHKVKFSMVEEPREESGPAPSQSEGTQARNIPEIRLSESEDVADHTMKPSDWVGRTNAAAVLAQSRASRLANRLSNSHNSHVPSRTSSGTTSPLIPNQQGYASPDSSPPTRPLRDWLVDIDDIPLTSLDKDKRPYTLHDDTTDDDDDDEIVEKERLKATRRKSSDDNMEEARRLIKTLTNGHNHLSKWQEPPPRLVQPQASIWLWICH